MKIRFYARKDFCDGRGNPLFKGKQLYTPKEVKQICDTSGEYLPDLVVVVGDDAESCEYIKRQMIIDGEAA